MSGPSTARRTPRRQVVRMASAVAAAIVLCAAAPRSQPQPAPGFVLPARNGTVALDSLRGRVVIVDFWASWCGPCRASFPWLKGLHERYAGRGLTIVAIGLDKDRAAAERFLAEFPAPFTVAFDPAGRSAAAYRVTGMPTLCVVGRDGTIAHRHAGYDPKKARQVEDLVREALAP